MAQRTKVILIDDLDGSDAEETITFGLDGVQYMIDLNSEHATQLRGCLADYIAAGRKQSARLRGSARPQYSRNPETVRENAAIRAWAAERGIEVNQRGRLPQEIIDQYRKEQA